ncbi:MAG: DUF2239 family protein [Gemmatimonadetes bacterium]|nr:DUF2239 family protein [Gemmatimonadota bacterium]MCC6769638.1 DUF2239 family protein [Gemmatimonadaceae bacterium]
MNHTTSDNAVVAFDGARLIGAGALASVLPLVRRVVAEGGAGPVLVFDATTSQLVELDLRDASERAVAGNLLDAATVQASAHASDVSSVAPPAADTPRGPGRPRLGVVAREVTLLPRHWDWLAVQPGGASAALRRLVEQARTAHAGRDRTRFAQEYAYRFMSAMLGDHPGFEEATRALFAGDHERFTAHSDAWPPDLRDHARRLASTAFPT